MQRRTTLSLLAAVGLFLVVAAAVGAFYVRQHGAAPAGAAATARDANAPPAATAAAYAAAADAFRSGDLDGGRQVLTALAEERPAERHRALLVLGLHYYANERYEAAEEILQLVSDPGGDLEDWRLFAMADAAARIGDDALAEQALSILLRKPNASPLRGRALIQVANREWERGQTERALRWIERARSYDLTAANATEMEVLAWRIAVELGDRDHERAAAKRLLVSSPVRAAELEVGDVFADERGRITTWEGVLTPRQVEQRAAGWLAAGRPLAAIASLATIDDDDRGLDWHLLQAEALTRQGKGADAYGLLRGLEAGSDADRARLEWERARAAADVAVARSGRTNAPQAARERMLDLSQQHLREVVRLGGDPARSLSAMRKLYAYLDDGGRFDEAMEMLVLLRQIDPADRTGAASLWERGWKEYQEANYTGAIGYWTQLEQIYPGDRDTHRGSYWKGRAFEELGQDGRARDVYEQVVLAADTADFYARRAADRLPGEPGPHERPGSQAPPWPSDVSLRRVLALSNFGLDSLAKLELESRGDGDEHPELARDIRALEGILTVRAGNPRQGVQDLKEAFPALGGPFQAAVPMPVLEAYYPLEYQQAIEKNARERGLPPSLVAGIIRQESAFDRRAQSWAGARGLMQIMPATAKEWAGKLDMRHTPERLFDPEYSIKLGSAYFDYVLDRFDGNVELALAGYNGGPNRIKRLWREAGADEQELDHFLESLDISESQAYVKRILVLSDSYRQLYPEYGKKKT
jgi:soluble lytic murein transglycosylase-like protein/TolA-binding protein